MSLITNSMKEHWREFLDDCYGLYQIKEEANWLTETGYGADNITVKQEIYQEYMLCRADEEYDPMSPIQSFRTFYEGRLIEKGVFDDKEDFINSKLFDEQYMHKLLEDNKIYSVYLDLINKYREYDEANNQGMGTATWEEVMEDDDIEYELD